MGLQVGEEADPGPTYIGAMWAWVGSGDCGFGLNLSASALGFCSTMEIVIILRRSVLDKLSPDRLLLWPPSS